MSYDIENIKAHPNAFEDGELVEMTEKIHGTLMEVAYWPESTDGPAQCAVSSKGMAHRGFIIEDCPANDVNIYVQVKRALNLDTIMPFLRSFLLEQGVLMVDYPVFVLGEVYGSASKQDLKYGADMAFHVFDIYVGKPGEGFYLAPLDRGAACRRVGLGGVPVLYLGPFSARVLTEFTNGLESLSGSSLHIREGVVVKPLTNREPVRGLGRVVLKSVSEAYLLRKGQVTEYE